MNNSITFQTFLGSEVADFSLQEIGKNTQISHAQSLKEQSAGIKVVDQITRTDTKGCCCNGRINKIPGI